MKFDTCRLCILLFCFSFSVAARAQRTSITDSTKNKLKAAAMDIIRTSPYCAMITIDKNNQPVARTMEPLEPDSNFVVWLGTNPRSRKVQEIKRNSTVCLYYGNTTANGYVTIRGKAQLINDEKEKTKHWKISWGPFYKNKTTDFLLIKVVPDRLEVINYRLGVTGNPVNWDVPYINF